MSSEYKAPGLREDDMLIIADLQGMKPWIATLLLANLYLLFLIFSTNITFL